MASAVDSADSSSKKKAFYSSLLENAQRLLRGQRDVFANTANIAALLYHSLRSTFGDSATNWAGFYLVRPVKDRWNGSDLPPSAADAPVDSKTPFTLHLGAFHGQPAVVPIPFDSGVCGAGARTMKTQLVPDVHAIPYHIACDSASNSEIVVPVFAPEESLHVAHKVTGSQTPVQRLVAVIDIDCPVKNGFDETDALYLEQLANLIGSSSDWVTSAIPVHVDSNGASCVRLQH